MALALIMFFSSCENEDEDQINFSSENIEELENIIISNNWAVTYYFDDKDETDDYQGYTFLFESSGTLFAINGESEIQGSWSISSSESSDDDSNDDVDFNIVFANPPELEELSDDWDIQQYSELRIELRDISGGDGSTDTLIFEKE